MTTKADPVIEAALDWAGALAIQTPTINRTDLKAAWDGDDGRRHREIMQAQRPEMLSQLAALVREAAARTRGQS